MRSNAVSLTRLQMHTWQTEATHQNSMQTQERKHFTSCHKTLKKTEKLSERDSKTASCVLFCFVFMADIWRHWHWCETSRQISHQRCSGEVLWFLSSLTHHIYSFILPSSFFSENYILHSCCCYLTLWPVCLYQEGQTCCFLRLLLRFYVERVFSNYASSHPQQQRCSSALANSFVSIRRDLHKCVSILQVNIIAYR